VAVVLSILASAASAAPTIQEVSPAAGFPWGGTQVRIGGVELIGETYYTCYDFSPCPIKVLFGDVEGDVIDATPSHVLVKTPPHARGVTNVTVKVNGRPDALLPNGFTFDDLASTTTYSSGADWTAFFVPVNANDVPGAHGSVWRTELSVHNPTEFTVPVDPCSFDGPGCERFALAPGETKSVRLFPSHEVDGGWLGVPAGIAGELAVSLRVRDLSRGNRDWGTEVPVLPLAAFTGRVSRLLDVPVNPDYRVLLRTFGSRRKIVTIYPFSGNQVLDELTFEDGDVVVDPITPAVRNSGHDRVRVVVQFQPGAIDEPPFNGGWAFISLTNNVTQHVTIISPHD
jgi:hypothetical protein